MISFFFHCRHQFIIDKVEELVKIILHDFAFSLENSQGSFGCDISCTAGHAHETTVDKICASSFSGLGVCHSHSQVAMAVEPYGNRHSGFQFPGIFSSLFREHVTCRIHDCNGLNSGIFQHSGFGGQFVWCKYIGFHQAVAGFQTGSADHFDSIYSCFAIPGISTDTEKAQTFMGSFEDKFLICIFGRLEHADMTSFDVRLNGI